MLSVLATKNKTDNKETEKEHRKFLEVMDMFSTLIVVMISICKCPNSPGYTHETFEMFCLPVTLQ